MNILFISSEVFPFVKTGGLADAVGAMVQILSKKNNVYVFLPEYKTDYIQGIIKQTVDSYKVKIGIHNLSVEIKKVLIKEQFQIFFVSQDLFFDRKYIYGNGESDYLDNFFRFLFFQKAIVQFLDRNSLLVDIIHCHDWQTALLPFLLKFSSNYFRNVPVIFTIHNLSYQGIFDKYYFNDLGIPKEFYSSEYFEFFDQINIVKSGIVFCDQLITVSPSYAKEITVKGMGFGLEGVLNKYSSKLIGILNGIDYSIWNPEIDPDIFQTYSHDSIHQKKVNKSLFLKKESLTAFSHQPLLIFIGRLVEQKGIHFIIQLIPDLIEHDLCLIVLGVGNRDYELELKKLSVKYEKQIRFFNIFDEKLAHQLQASADILLMPSLHEPCGLNQLCSLHYGTLPVTFNTGGLKDTVIDLEREPVRGTGFVAFEMTYESFHKALKNALLFIRNESQLIAFQKRVMKIDFSWEKVSEKYFEIYSNLLKENKDERNC